MEDGKAKQAVARAAEGEEVPVETLTSKGPVSAPSHNSIVEGFKINYLSMRDADTGKVMWTSASQWKHAFKDGAEVRVELPKQMLKCRAVSREMGFSSVQEIKDFRLVQDVYLHGNAIEEWRFQFGFVIPDSKNTWQCVIQSAGEDNMIPAEVLSGNLTIETQFYDKNDLVCKCVCRVYYV